MNSELQELKFEEWAIVDVMGHQRYVGRVSEETIAGTGFVRIDIPSTGPEHPEWTKLIGPSSIYAITPVSEEIARQLCDNNPKRPVQAYELTPKLTHESSVLRGIDDEDDWNG